MAHQTRVLIVDDDPSTLSTYSSILLLEGYDVVTAYGGREGLMLLRSRSFDLVLTDLRMPDVSGLELLAEAREFANSVSVVLYTAFGSNALEAAARRLGAVDFSGELWDVGGLVRVVKKNIASSAHATVRKLERIGPATRRWASFVVAVVESPDDVPTVERWATEFQFGLATIKRCCLACGVRAANSLDFARGLRVVRLYSGQHMTDWYDTLEIYDPTTMAHFLERAGFTKSDLVPAKPDFLKRQRLITKPSLLYAAETITR